jgi:hypothetical protein
MQIHVGKYALTPDKTVAGTVGSYGFERMKLVFDPFWESLTKRIVFESADGECVSLVLDADAEIVLPREVTRCAGVCRYAVVGYEGEKIIITLAGELMVLETLPSEGDAPEKTTPSITAQILERLERLGKECRELWQALYHLQERLFSNNEKIPPARGRPPRTEETRIKGTEKEKSAPAPAG